MATDKKGNVHHFNRFELKYLIPRNLATEVKKALSPYVNRDPYLFDNNYYRVKSVYFDNDSLIAFWEKMDGIKFRRKLRVRFYGETIPDFAFLEIKQKIDKTVQKRRTRHKMNDVLTTLVKRNDDLLKGEVAEESMLLLYAHAMKPKILINYWRDAYAAKKEPGVRITFDTNGRYRTNNLFKDKPNHNDDYFLHPAWSIMEVKFDHAVPSWMLSIIRGYNLQMKRVSKYCEGINLAHFNGNIF